MRAVAQLRMEAMMAEIIFLDREWAWSLGDGW